MLTCKRSIKSGDCETKKKKKKEAISIGSCRVHSPFDISDMHSTFVNSYATTFQHLVYPQVRSGEENVRIISFVGDNPTRISIYRHIPCEYSNFKLDSVQYYCAETVQQCTWKDRKKKLCHNFSHCHCQRSLYSLQTAELHQFYL